MPFHTSLINLKEGREKSILRRHPWIFSGAIERVVGHPQLGETVEVRASDGTFLARGAYSPHSQIAVRIWTFDKDEDVTSAFFRLRLERAIISRRLLWSRDGSASCRLVNAESDGLPGLIVDRYGDILVCQFLSAGAEFWKREILVQLGELAPTVGIYERSDVDVRQKEGLPLSSGNLSGEEPPDLVDISEGTCRFLVDIRGGHKTGFYLDQRDNRSSVTEYANGAEVLDCFAYTGGFGIYALKAGATKVTMVESSQAWLNLARRNVAHNGVNETKVEMVEGDAFHVLRQCRDARLQFDLVVLDPPKFAKARGHVERASRGYKDINLLAFKLLRPGGILLTFSCSGLVATDLFQKIVADAARDAGREAQILRHLSQAADHPTALHFPEGTYLKGLVCRVW